MPHQTRHKKSHFRIRQVFADAIARSYHEGLPSFSVVTSKFFVTEPSLCLELVWVKEISRRVICCPMIDAYCCLSTFLVYISCTKVGGRLTPSGTNFPHTMSPPDGTSLGSVTGTGENILKPSSKQACRYFIFAKLCIVISSTVLKAFRISVVSLVSADGF